MRFLIVLAILLSPVSVDSKLNLTDPETLDTRILDARIKREVRVITRLYLKDKYLYTGIRRFTKRISIIVREIPGLTGWCQIPKLKQHNRHYVHIDRFKYLALTKLQRKIVVYHEYGHCDLGYAHSDFGIMISKVPSAKYLKSKSPESLRAMIRQLFTASHPNMYSDYMNYTLIEVDL